MVNTQQRRASDGIAWDGSPGEFSKGLCFIFIGLGCR